MAASKLVEKLDREFLECGICLDRFVKPRALPCLHSFCHECLERYCTGRKQVVCPNCKKPVQIPEEGVSGFPAHFMVNSLQDTLDMEKLKVKDETTDDTPCSNCNLPDKKAIVRCLDCKEFFCEACHASHNTFKVMKQHKVVSMEDVRSGKSILPIMPMMTTQKCEEHEDETKKFYCETCGKLICRDCIVLDHRTHQYVSMIDATKKRIASLVELTKQGEDFKKKCQDAIQKTETVKKNLAIAIQKANQKLDMKKNEYHKQVDTIFNKRKADVYAQEVGRTKELDRIEEELKKTLTKVENQCDLAAQVTQADSGYDILSIYPSLSASLEEIHKITEPTAADETLGYVEVEVVGKQEIVDAVRVQRGNQWKQTGQFSTQHADEELTFLYGIAVHSDGVAIIDRYYHSNKSSAKVFSKDGNVIYTFKGSFDAGLSDIAITPDNRYILPGKGEILFYNSQGNKIKSTNAATYDINNKPSNPITLAVDSRFRIIAGLHGNTISIHHADGKFISKFHVPGQPRMLAVTCKGDIAVICIDDTLKVMDYSGNNVRVVKPPQGVLKWEPWSVCCSTQGEIFVMNCGVPAAVFRYTADGDQCLGCVVRGLGDPSGIAITEDGEQMFVTEYEQCQVKIFQRQ